MNKPSKFSPEARDRQLGRQWRQRPGRDNQRSLQGRMDPSPGALEDSRLVGARDARMGVLIQPSPTAGAHRLHPTCRGSGKLL